MDTDLDIRIAVCIGGTNTSLALLDAADRILEKISIPTFCGGELMDACKAAKDRIAFTLKHRPDFIKHRAFFLDELCHKISELANFTHRNNRILLGVGVSAPGAIHPHTGHVLGKAGALNLPAWGEFNLREEIHFRTGLEVFAINDAKAMALGALARIQHDVLRLTDDDEERPGEEGASITSFIEIDPGTGLGGAYVVNKKIWFGGDPNNPDPDVGEIWKLKPDPDQPDIHFEELCSGRATLNRVKNALVNPGAEERIQEMLKQGSPDQNRIIKDQLVETGRLLGLGVLCLMTREKERLNAPDISTFMFGGGMVSGMSHEAKAVRRSLYDGIRSVIKDGSVKILFSTLGSKAGVYGSAALVG